MEQTLYFFKFNNYYNRILKKYDTIEEYIANATLIHSQTETAFNPNDGILTTQVVNSNDGFDYLVITEGSSNEEIISRWFVIEANRNLAGQYTVHLKRDVLADTYEPIINSPCYIEKATLSNFDPFIYNSEGVNVNQIKKNEKKIQDQTKIPWIVGYVAKDDGNGQKPSFNKTMVVNNVSYAGSLENFVSLWNSHLSTLYGSSQYIVADHNTNSNSLWTAINFETSKYLYDSDTNPGINFCYIYHLESNINSSTSSPAPGGSTNPNLSTKGGNATEVLSYFKNNYSSLQSSIKTYFNFSSQSVIDSILFYNGKIFKDNNNNYYRVSIVESSISDSSFEISGSNGGIVFQQFNNLVSTCISNGYMKTFADPYSLDGYKFYVNLKNQPRYTYTLEPVGIGSNSSISINVNTGTSYRSLNNEPYSMFAIPYGACKVRISNIEYNFSENDTKAITHEIASNLIETWGGNSPILYDIQILPYCPLANAISNTGEIILTDSTSYTSVTNSFSETVGVILWADNSQFELTIPFNEFSYDNIKISNECDMLRLCSPNWNGQFEFNPAKNGGVQSFNIDCQYKPFVPYIHVNPNFKELYGADFNDARGLICGGDFSLTQISDSWATYERENKNYQNIFDRQIQNMETINNINNEQTRISGAISAVSNAIGTGVGLGVVNPIAGAVGGLISGAASYMGTELDISYTNKRLSENISSQRDIFNYQLDNIRALPNSLTKVSALNNNNKIFPLLEIYSCTDEEKKAIANLIAYNGMTVNRIGTINEFLNNSWSYSYTENNETKTISDKGFIKCQLIKLENSDFADDYSFVNEISKELKMGVYFK